jgi:hypothetical protein
MEPLPNKVGKSTAYYWPVNPKAARINGYAAAAH